MSTRDPEAFERMAREITSKYGHMYQRIDPNAPAKEFKAAELNMADSPIFDEVLADSDPDIFLASNIFPNPTVESTESLSDALSRIGHPQFATGGYIPPLQPAFTDWSVINRGAA